MGILDEMIGVKPVDMSSLTQQIDRYPIDDTPFHPKRSKFLHTLGGIGDALLMASGEQARYRPVYEQAMIGDYMRNRDIYPDYADRMITGLNPAFGEKLDDNRRAARRDDAMAGLRTDQLERQKLRDKQIYQDKGVDRISAIATTIRNNKGTPEQKKALWAQWLPILTRTASQYEMDPSEIPANYDESWLETASGRGIKSNQQVDDVRDDAKYNTDREYKRGKLIQDGMRTDIQRDNANTNSRRADNAAANNGRRADIAQQNANTAEYRAKNAGRGRGLATPPQNIANGTRRRNKATGEIQTYNNGKWN